MKTSPCILVVEPVSRSTQPSTWQVMVVPSCTNDAKCHLPSETVVPFISRCCVRVLPNEGIIHLNAINNNNNNNNNNKAKIASYG